MTAKVTELKTNRDRSKEGMLTYLDDLRKEVESDKITSLIFIVGDVEDTFRTQIIGDIPFMEAVGMFDTAKMACQLSHFQGGFDDEDE
jgi:hypothetical protein